MKDTRFFLWDVLGDSNDTKLCVIDESVPQAGFGEKTGPDYPKDARIYLSKKGGTELSSFLANTESVLIGSGELKAAIEKYSEGTEIEFLPFTLYDKKKQVCGTDYYIINPIGTFDCLDFKASKITWDDDEPGEIIRIRKHVLDKKKLKNAPQLFRIDKDPCEYVVGLKLVRELQAKNLTNIFLEELEITNKRKG